MSAAFKQILDEVIGIARQILKKSSFSKAAKNAATASIKQAENLAAEAATVAKNSREMTEKIFTKVLKTVKDRLTVALRLTGKAADEAVTSAAAAFRSASGAAITTTKRTAGATKAAASRFYTRIGPRGRRIAGATAAAGMGIGASFAAMAALSFSALNGATFSIISISPVTLTDDQYNDMKESDDAEAEAEAEAGVSGAIKKQSIEDYKKSAFFKVIYNSMSENKEKKLVIGKYDEVTLTGVTTLNDTDKLKIYFPEEQELTNSFIIKKSAITASEAAAASDTYIACGVESGSIDFAASCGEEALVTCYTSFWSQLLDSPTAFANSSNAVGSVFGNLVTGVNQAFAVVGYIFTAIFLICAFVVAYYIYSMLPKSSSGSGTSLNSQTSSSSLSTTATNFGKSRTRSKSSVWPKKMFILDNIVKSLTNKITD